MLDKARADILGINGEYNFTPAAWALTSGNSPGSTIPNSETLSPPARATKTLTAGSVTTPRKKNKKAIIKWNNEMRCLRLCDLSEQVQEYFETYIPQFCHPPSKVKFFFDVYDVEEGVL